VIPYGRQSIDDDDIRAVVDVLKSDWLTNGPNVEAFEKAVAEYVGVKYAVAFSNGTAALHGITNALGVTGGDEVITTPMTFAASANCIIYQGGTPVFADINPDTLLIEPVSVAAKITNKTKAVIAVDYAGQPCDYAALREICTARGIALIADGCHALGASWHGTKVGAVADMTAFSFHPVKHITTGEGGMVCTDNQAYAASLKLFRNHGITTDFRQRQELGGWFYEMEELGYNYRITDIQCALGKSQLKKLDGWIARRNELADKYDKAFSGVSGIEPVAQAKDITNAYHLYVIRSEAEKTGVSREAMFAFLRSAGIGVNVHYIPVHLHPYYRRTYGYGKGLCPVAEAEYEKIISIPMFPALTDSDQDYVIQKIMESVNA
jgi:perosamine synthetase